LGSEILGVRARLMKLLNSKKRRARNDPRRQRGESEEIRVYSVRLGGGRAIPKRFENGIV